MSGGPEAPRGARSLAKRLPGVPALLASPAWKRFIHWRIVRFAPRRNDPFTRFLRLPTQFEALVGPVLDFLALPAGAPLRMICAGCSNGAETVTIAATLAHHRPGLAFHIDAFDIDPAVLAVASAAEYTEQQVRGGNPFMTDAFVSRVFDVDGDRYRVKPEILGHLTYGPGSLLDADYIAHLGRADVVFAQNFLFHLPRRLNAAALRSLCAMLEPRAALFIEGMDEDLRVKLTRRAGLRPLAYRIERIHAEGRERRGAFWPWHYTGLEPWDPARRNRDRWYGTIYLREADV